MISNPNNPTIRSTRKLRTRRGRERQRAIMVEGHRALAVALSARPAVRRVFHTPSAATRREGLLRAARAAGAELFEISERVMAALTSVETAPDVVGVAPINVHSLADAASRFGLGVVLAGVRDPATAGSILASCAAAGGAVALATHGTTDLYAAKPVRSAAGAHFVLDVVVDVDPEECVRALREAGVRMVVISATGGAPETADLTGRVALVVGEEGAVPEALEAAAEGRVGLGPGATVRPSLAVEAGVVLFEAARMRGRGAGGPTAASGAAESTRNG